MPNDYDKILRENLDALMPFLAQKLLGLDLSRTETLKDKIQVTLEREGDFFKKVLHNDPALDYGLHWEFQSADGPLTPATKVSAPVACTFQTS